MSQIEKKNILISAAPLALAFCIGLGIWVGAFLFGGPVKGKLMGTSLNKFREVLGVLEGEYVDTLDADEVTENAIHHILRQLDPHSSYIEPEDLELSKTSLESGFEGIGIEFLIINDTVQVISALKGGPSDLVGILPGDRILSADGNSLTKSISNKEVFSRLRGKQGTNVELSVKRPGLSELLHFQITRARISSHSVEASFLLKPGLGYLKISRFSDNTYVECKSHLEQLKQIGAKSLILDLRDNPGGYLDRATKLVDEFLPDNRMIVYTDGKAKKYDQKYFSGPGGLFLDAPLIVLVNEGSASASEILAGAIQDNDRGLIVGRRTFGKGLVQVPISLKDGSELRLTISRYYTPSGRCIQKPYKSTRIHYDEELDQRLQSGELFEPDSIQPNPDERFETITGRAVFGGGGIIPDVFVPLDTQSVNQFLIEMMRNNLFREFALIYYKEHQKELEQIRKRVEPPQLNLDPGIWKRFVEFTFARKVVWPVSKQRLGTELYLTHLLRAYIARLVWGDNGYYMVLSQKDPMVLTALRKMEEAARLYQQSKKTPN